MLTRLTVRNFKLFEEIDIELDQHVVFVGPNNSGKTTALQALTLWELGKNRWLEKRGGEDVPTKRPGVAIGRRDSLALPVPSANLLWRNLRTRNMRKGAQLKFCAIFATNCVSPIMMANRGCGSVIALKNFLAVRSMSPCSASSETR